MFLIITSKHTEFARMNYHPAGRFCNAVQTYCLNISKKESDVSWRKLESKEEVYNVLSRPSRINGENIAGAAFLFFSALFMFAGQLNGVFAVLYPVDFMLLAFGIGLIVLGYRTWRNELKRVLIDSGNDKDRY